MLSSIIFLFSFLNLLLHTSSEVTFPFSSPDEIILVNCGTSTSLATSTDNYRPWNGDSHSKLTSSNFKTSLESKAILQHPTISSSVSYMTARISDSNITYSFPSISPGPKFIRLYFYPTTYTSSNTSTYNFNTSSSLFTVTANNFTLLKNFSASLNILASDPQERVAYIIKEFIVPVQKNKSLDITFSPVPSSLVFINGIEIVPIPDDLYIKDKDYPITFVNYQTLCYFNDFTSLETIYRLNVGGRFEIDAEMFRRWSDDTNYINGWGGFVSCTEDTIIKYTHKTPSYAVPSFLYTTVRSMGPNPLDNLKYNLTWSFSVDSGFNYLVRMHFCETEKFVNATFQRVFFVFINDMIAEESLDVIFSAGGNDIPVYKDYIVQMPEENQRKKELSIALYPRSDTIYADAILNGLEIFKLSKSDGDLSGNNPEYSTPEQPSASRKRSKSESTVLQILSAVLGVVFVLCLIIFFLSIS
ncbi:Malectin/receptor-like protein kinase family protein [Euphorbia peplus]|nr:Malectin/receptor-like protein kinase family protein [Euphorbia peplus]